MSYTFKDKNNQQKEIQPKLNEIYISWGFDVISRKEEQSSYDLIIRNRKSLKEYTVEEKIVFPTLEPYSCICIELIQDIPSHNMGWIFKCEADYLFYTMCIGGLVSKIYVANFNNLKEWYFKNCKKYNKFNITPEGYGITLNHLIPIKEIPYLVDKPILL